MVEYHSSLGLSSNAGYVGGQVMRNAVLALVFSAGLMASSSCQAGLQEGTVAYLRGNYKTALKEFRILAEQGNAEAQFNLGIMYVEGKGVSKDNTEAVKWYRKAAEQGDAQAQNNLGLMYSEGEGVPEDYMEAVKWYRKAAEQGECRGCLKPSA